MAASAILMQNVKLIHKGCLLPYLLFTSYYLIINSRVANSHTDLTDEKKNPQKKKKPQKTPYIYIYIYKYVYIYEIYFF